MDVEVFRNPVQFLVFKNLFSKPANKRILNEIISLEKEFNPSYTGGKAVPNPNMRTNTVAYLDNIYRGKRDTSFFLMQLDKLLQSNLEFREILASSQYPVSDFLMTNRHETQISRYGGEDTQYYEWHIDRYSNTGRHLTLVYYFFKEPREFVGGHLQFTNSPIYNGKAIEKDAEIVEVTPENNMGVVFGSYTPHRVLPTTSPKEFGKGRFSSNIWIGK